MIYRQRPAGNWFREHPYIIDKAPDTRMSIEAFNPETPTYRRYDLPVAIPGFYQHLRADFGNKCVFCETRVDTHPDESLYYWYRPARAATQLNDTESAKRDHYFWLQLEWKNIYLICGDCGSHKRFLFPIAGERAPIGSQGDDLIIERPLLLDPCVFHNNPLPHFAFAEDGTVSGSTAEGKATIETVRLNRPKLCEARATAIQQLRQRFEFVSNTSASDPELPHRIEQLSVECAELSEYAGMKRQMLYTWSDARLERRKAWKKIGSRLQIWNKSPIGGPVLPPISVEGNGFSEGYAVLCGVSQYVYENNFPTLRTAREDAEEMHEVLRDSEQCGYGKNNITLLTDQEATKPQIMAALAGLAEISTTKPDITALFFFSGHGMLVDQRFYLLPHTANVHNLAETAISGEEFFDAIRAIRSQRRLILLDCCHAGAISGMAQAKDGAAATISIAGMPHSIAQEALRQNETTAIISSSTQAQKSYSVGERTKLSLFTNILVEAFRGKATDATEKWINVFDIIRYVNKEVNTVAGKVGVDQEPHVHFNGRGFSVARRPSSS